jgi:hypothetical protein
MAAYLDEQCAEERLPIGIHRRKWAAPRSYPYLRCKVLDIAEGL